MKTRICLLLIAVAAMVGCRKTEQIIDNRVDPVDFLSDKKYKSLVVEIQYVDGYKPEPETMNRLKTFMEQRLNKPAGIAFVYHAIPSPGLSFYDVTDAERIERQYREEDVHGATIAAYFLFVDGPYARDDQNAKVLGIAYGGSSVIMFGKTIHDYSGAIGEPNRDVLESTVIEHEFGHLMGLVDDGTKMAVGHLDGAHGHHCDNSACLMYYSTETSDIIGNLVGNNVPALDEHCIRDLQLNGGK